MRTYYIKVAILGISFLFTSCLSYKPYSKAAEKTEIIKRLEYPNDGKYFASSEMELQRGIKLPVWNIPELEPIKKHTEVAISHQIIKKAKTFEGTPYKFGGVTNKGMDCSGLIYTSFKSQNIYLPRVSKDMATQGKRVQLKNVLPGDLVFFKTNQRSNVINHVGIVVEGQGDNVKFIHSSTSRGVIISSIKEAYWQRAFTEARRVL